MPIDNEYQAIYQIPENPNLQRYMSLEKFVSLISRRSLFFTRLDKLEDPFEGTTPQIVKGGYRRWYKMMISRGYFEKPMSEEEIEKNCQQIEDNNEKMRSLFTVNCWHIREAENALMWKAYSSANSGIMIKTTYDQMAKSLNQTKESVQSSLVSYRNFETDHTIPFGNSTYLATHKTEFYSGENELRLIHKVSDTMWVHEWDKEESSYGVNLAVDVSELIQEIRLAPFTPTWFLDVVKDICEKFGINKEVLRSSLEK